MPRVAVIGIGGVLALALALALAVARVAAELAALGAEPRERTPPREPDLWWE